jgi:phosphomannomutase
VYEGSTNVYRDEWELPDDVELFLCDELDYSQFPIRNGLHIERRPGGVNFSILGRGEGEGRDQYVKWDKRKNERMDIAYRLKERFPDLEVQVGGQTGLDLAPLGRNKSQILRDFKWFHELYFFGDMMEIGQNDYPLAKEIRKRGGKSYTVDGYVDTMKILKGLL